MSSELEYIVIRKSQDEERERSKASREPSRHHAHTKEEVYEDDNGDLPEHPGDLIVIHDVVEPSLTVDILVVCEIDHLHEEYRKVRCEQRIYDLRDDTCPFRIGIVKVHRGYREQEQTRIPENGVIEALQSG